MKPSHRLSSAVVHNPVNGLRTYHIPIDGSSRTPRREFPAVMPFVIGGRTPFLGSEIGRSVEGSRRK